MRRKSPRTGAVAARGCLQRRRALRDRRATRHHREGFAFGARCACDSTRACAFTAPHARSECATALSPRRGRFRLLARCDASKGARGLFIERRATGLDQIGPLRRVALAAVFAWRPFAVMLGCAHMLF
eukprot:Amastigsp_a842016_11.p2 type:complete len:128 gc:universal Amastigsp_a842016_11:501-118(-)